MNGIVVAKAGDLLEIVSPYEARHLVGKIPGSRWVKAPRLWTVPAVALPLVREALKPWPAGVVYALDPKAAAPSPEWVTALFAGIPEHLHKRTYRALAGVLHPDHGGDDAAMKQLNDKRPTRRNQ